MKNRNILFFLTVTILLSPQLSMCSESQEWSYMPSFFKAGGKALQSAANYAGNSMLSLWNSMNDRAKMVFFGAIAATLVAAGYKIWWQKPDSDKIEEVAQPVVEKKQKSSTSSSSVEPEEEVIEPSELLAGKEETTEEYQKRFEESKQQKKALALADKQRRQKEREEQKKQQLLKNPVVAQPSAIPASSPIPSTISSSLAERLKKQYPIFLFNGYNTKIVYNLTDVKGFESGELEKRAKVQIGSASLTDGQVTFKNTFQQNIPTIQVRSSGPGSGWGARPWTNFDTDFNTNNKKGSSLSIWKGLIEYHITQSANPQAKNNKEIDSFDIDLLPQESKGWLQALPTTPFEGTLTPRYSK